MTTTAVACLLSSVFVLLWPLIIFFGKKEVLRCQWLYIFTQLVVAFSVQLYSTYFIHSLSTEYVVSYIFMSLSLFGAPMYYLFIVSVTSEEGIMRHHRRVFWLPVVYALVLAVATMLLTAQGCRLFLSRVVQNGNTDFIKGFWQYNVMVVVGYYGFLLLLVSEAVVLSVVSAAKTIRFHRTFEDYYANHYRRQRQSNVIMMVVSFVVVVVSVMVALFPFQRIPSRWFVLSLAFLAVAMELVLGFYAYNISYNAETLERAKNKVNESQGGEHPSATTPRPRVPLGVRLTELIETNQYYLNPKANLIEVANRLHVPETQIIEHLYNAYQCSFSKYINGLRINKAINIMVGLPSDELRSSKRVEAVYTLCGYDKKSDFQRCFYHIMGVGFQTWVKEPSRG